MLFFKSGCDPPATAGGSVYRGGKRRLPQIAPFFIAVAKHIHPFEERRSLIQCWKDQAAIVISETPQTIALAGNLQNTRIRSKDAPHVACAIQAQCDYFVTTDDVLLKCMSGFSGIRVVNPIDMTRIVEPE